MDVNIEYLQYSARVLRIRVIKRLLIIIAVR